MNLQINVPQEVVNESHFAALHIFSELCNMHLLLIDRHIVKSKL